MEPTPQSPRILVVYYSRTGATRQAAQQLAELLGEQAETEQIVDHVDRSGPAGYVRSAWEAARKKTPPVDPPSHDPSRYDLVVLATPVWVAGVASPVRAWLDRYAGTIKHLAILYTAHIRHYNHLAEDVCEDWDLDCRECVGLTHREVVRQRHRPRLEQFAETLREASPAAR